MTALQLHPLQCAAFGPCHLLVISVLLLLRASLVQVFDQANTKQGLDRHVKQQVICATYMSA